MRINWRAQGIYFAGMMMGQTQVYMMHGMLTVPSAIVAAATLVSHAIIFAIMVDEAKQRK